MLKKTSKTINKTQVKPKISVIGLGKLGACYVPFYASRGYSVIGYDINERNVNLINEGRAPVEEPRLADMLAKHKANISATSDLEKLLKESDITFIILPTPSRPDGLFSTEYVVSAAKAIGPHLKKKKGYHLFVLVSTVLPGDSRNFIIPTFEKYSGKKVGRDFGFAYSPSLIAIGDIFSNLENPDFVFLGSYDEKSREILRGVYETIYGKEKPIQQSSIESAELAKISLNSYVTMKITFANILGELCENIPFAHVDEVTSLLGKDKRIGSRYLNSGLGFGGPCFPRDNRALAAMSKKYGVDMPHAEITDELNNRVWKNAVKKILDCSGKDSSIGVLGIAYKPNTMLAEDSQALYITEELINKGENVTIYEPLGNAEAEKIFKARAKYVKTFKELVNKNDVIFVSNKDNAFLGLPVLLAQTKSKKTVIDPWGMFTKKDFSKNVTYISHGRKS